jgi:hypothetical protein
MKRTLVLHTVFVMHLFSSHMPRTHNVHDTHALERSVYDRNNRFAQRTYDVGHAATPTQVQTLAALAAHIQQLMDVGFPYDKSVLVECVQFLDRDMGTAVPLLHCLRFMRQEFDVTQEELCTCFYQVRACEGRREGRINEQNKEVAVCDQPLGS